MEIIIKENIEPLKFPLPIYNSIYIGNAVARDGEKFSIFVGLDEKAIARLKTLSLDKNDAELQRNTSDFQRFGLGLYEDWYKKERTLFALVHNKTGALAAIVWFGPKPLHKGCKCHTVGWRSYNPFRGKGLTKDFVNFAMSIYKKNLPDVKLWARIKKENTGSLGLAQNLGFQISEEFSDDVSLVLINA